MAAGAIGEAWDVNSWDDTAWDADSWGPSDNDVDIRRAINARRRRRCAIAMYVRRRRF